MTACALERAWFFITNGRIRDPFVREIMDHVRNGRTAEALRRCGETPGVVSRVIESGVASLGLPRQDAEINIEFEKSRAETLLSKHFVVFGTISFIAPLLGLLGTVLGIIRAFNDIAVTGAGGPAVISAGISEALFTTAAGIIIAVPAAVIYNVFQSRVQDIVTGAEAAARNILAGGPGGMTLNNYEQPGEPA